MLDMFKCEDAAVISSGRERQWSFSVDAHYFNRAVLPRNFGMTCVHIEELTLIM